MAMSLLPALIAAQLVQAAPGQPVPAAPVAPPILQPWNPAAAYISAGQDEPGYRSWYLAAPWRAAQVKSYNEYLATHQVAGILPTWQLLRTATSWQECGGQPFEVPPAEDWPNMVQTLRYVHDYVVPAVGPVEAVSVYRNPTLNQCAGGAPESAHKLDSAIDLVPLRPTDRITLMRTLCGIHSEHGAPYNAGLGFYAFLRFHVDSTKFRRWNMDPAVAAECPPLIRPEDIASVGQPAPAQAAPAPATGLPGPPTTTAPGGTPAAPAATAAKTPERGESH